MKHELKFKGFKIDNITQDESNQLIVSGWAAIFGNIDSYGDIIQPGAFTKTLQERKGRIAFCYQHELDEPVGKILLLEERDKGLWIEVMISAAEEDIQTKIREGILQEMSIGYCTLKSNQGIENEQPINYLTEIKLYEVSLVTIAANPLATIEELKSEEKANYFDESFERLIVTERDNTKKFDLMKLKSQVIALLNKEPDIEPTPIIEEPQEEVKEIEQPAEVIAEQVLTKEEILYILKNGRN